MWNMSVDHSLSHIPTRDSGHHTISRSTQYEDVSRRPAPDSPRKPMNIAETVRIIKMFNPTNTQAQQTDLQNKLYSSQSMPSSLGVDSSLHPLATKLREKKREMAEKSLTSKSQHKALVVVNRKKHAHYGNFDATDDYPSPRKDNFDRSLVYPSGRKLMSSESTKSSSLLENDCSTVDKQRAELGLLIVELKERDRELNDMVASHQHQLESWEHDRDRVHSLESQCARLEGEQNMRSSQVRTLVKRVRVLESSDQSRLTALESTQQQLIHITEQHCKAAQRIQELQEKKESLSQTLKHLAVRSGQLEAREEELSTLLKLKDADLCTANERIQGLTKQVKQLQNTCLQLQDEEVRLQKLVVEGERKHNTKMEELAKMKADLELSQQWEHGSQRALDQHRAEVLALQKQLRLSAERERRKDELIESQRLRQERTDTELANMRKLYERQVHDMSSLQQNLRQSLKQTKPSFEWESTVSKEEDEELSELSTSYQSITNPEASKPSSPQPMSAASRQLSQSAPDCHQVSPKDSPRPGLPAFPENPPNADPVDKPDMKKWAFSNILRSDDFLPMRRHGSESDVQGMMMMAKSCREPSSLNQSHDGIAVQSPPLTSRSERHLSNLEMLDKFRLTALSSDLDKAGISDSIPEQTMSRIALNSSEEETEMMHTREGEGTENVETQTSRKLINHDGSYAEPVHQETNMLSSPPLKPNVQKCVADKDEEKDLEEQGNKSGLADSSYEVVDSDSIANIRLITDSQEIAARISDLLTNDISQSEASTGFSSPSGHDRDLHGQSEVNQAISQSVSHLLAPTPPETMDPDSSKSSINAWVRQSNRNRTNLLREYDFIDSLEHIPCEPVMIDLNDSTDTNGSTLEALEDEEKLPVRQNDIELDGQNHNRLHQRTLFSTNNPDYGLNAQRAVNEARHHTYSFDMNFPSYGGIPRGPPEHPHVMFDDSMSSALSGLMEDEAPVKEEPVGHQPAHKPKANSPTTELERILAESDAMVASFEHSFDHEDGLNQSKGSKVSWPMSHGHPESEDSNGLIDCSVDDFAED